MAMGAKGRITFSSVRNWRNLLVIYDPFSHMLWLLDLAGGVFLPPCGQVEQWLVSARHDQATPTASWLISKRSRIVYDPDS